jgi:hypothetical protein
MNKENILSSPLLPKFMWVAFVSGVILGQLVDFAYPISDALHYHDYVWKVGALEFCWLIDILYGVASVIFWVCTVYWDKRYAQKPKGGLNPSWKFVLAGCAYFIALFYIGPYMSGILKLNNALIFAFTMSTGILCWWVFDGTRGGVYMMIVAGTLGPIAELFMINVMGFYEYTRPDIWGIPLWFIGAYISGAGACGNLARKYLAHLENTHTQKSTVADGWSSRPIH